MQQVYDFYGCRKTWDIRETPHGDNHDIWINPNHENIWIQSNDGGKRYF